MEKITFSELYDRFYEHNKINNVSQFEDDHAMFGVIRFKQGPWFNAEYTDTQRTYFFSSANKYFIPNMGGNSLFADCLDGCERGVRLDWYLNKWQKEYCAIVNKEEFDELKKQAYENGNS